MGTMPDNENGDDSEEMAVVTGGVLNSESNMSRPNEDMSFDDGEEEFDSTFAAIVNGPGAKPGSVGPKRSRQGSWKADELIEDE